MEHQRQLQALRVTEDRFVDFAHDLDHDVFAN